jgi:hypothetical protein
VGASDLSWSGPDDCAQSEQLVFQVERALGAPLASTGQVHLQVHVARTAPTAQALLRIADDAAALEISERRLVAPDCDKLVDPLAVAIALAIEAAAPPMPAAHAIAGAGTALPLPEPPPTNASNAGPSEPSLDRSASDADERAAPGPVPRVTARLLGDVGSLPAPAVGVALGAQLGWSRWLLELTGALWSERHARLDSATAPDAGADVSLATGTLAACALPLDASSMAIALCAGWEMGRVSGIGTGISSPRRVNGLWLAPSIDVGLGWQPPGSRLGLGLRVGAAAPLGERSFYLERLGTVHEVASLVARAGLSVEVALE